MVFYDVNFFSGQMAIKEKPNNLCDMESKKAYGWDIIAFYKDNGKIMTSKIKK